MKISSAARPAAPAKILLVDDNNHGLIARKAILTEQGHQVATAANGQTALEILNQGNFDLVITDYVMPDMDGVALIRQVRESQPSASIVLLSGFVDMMFLNETTTGADAVICKSAGEIPALLRTVSKLMAAKACKKPAASVKPVAKTKTQIS